MGSEGPSVVTVHVTGFKKFHGVAENPTETIVSNLKGFMQEKGLPKGLILGKCNVLETAGHGALAPLYHILESSTSESSNSGRIIWKVPIIRSDGNISRTRETSLPVNEITKALAKMGYEVMSSDDAGRFVCNYVYYHSLRFAEQHGIKSLFVHVPLFLTIDEETQMQFAASLLEVLASLH
ncbi:peptidase C15, pyroglutamyl peptidase I-like protein isoform X2 [Tasmannia lanceolata]|uniref:peptidase C15, pyroglutamyl peptidase I-like protein isoform X2 n=1 Tax=Tasmannia lanceolata TaxID=3420 RepID=UPI004064B54F